jgi:hypothetical protein
VSKPPIKTNIMEIKNTNGIMKVTNDDTRDVAIRVVEYLIDNKYITEFEDENEWDFHIQDVIHEKINKLLNIDNTLVESVDVKCVTNGEL